MKRNNIIARRLNRQNKFIRKANEEYTIDELSGAAKEKALDEAYNTLYNVYEYEMDSEEEFYYDLSDEALIKYLKDNDFKFDKDGNSLDK